MKNKVKRITLDTIFSKFSKVSNNPFLVFIVRDNHFGVYAMPTMASLARLSNLACQHDNWIKEVEFYPKMTDVTIHPMYEEVKSL